MLSEERRQRNKKRLGETLKTARQDKGLTQKGLASQLGLEYYTMISQMELGYISIPPSLWVPIARTLDMDVSGWVLRCLREYQPEVFHALFLNRSMNEASATIEMLHRGLLDELIVDFRRNERT